MATTTGYQRWAVCMILICSMITNGETIPTTRGNTPGTTESKPAEPFDLVWILPLALVVGGVIILCGVVVAYKLHLKKYQPPTDSDETIHISKGPTNDEDCKEYVLKAEIDSGGLKTKWRVFASKNNSYSSLRLVTVAGNGDMVMLDNDAIRVMSKKLGKTISKICAPAMDEYVAVATSKRQPGEVLVARKGGKISFLNLSDGKEEEIEGLRDHPQGKISDMDVDDMGNIYVTNRDKKCIRTYDVNGSLKSTFNIGDFPQCISACDDGILYVLCRRKIKSDNGCDIEGVVIKRYTNGLRDDFDIKCPKGVNIVTTGLYSSTTSLYVLTKDEESDEEASAKPDKEASAKPDKEASAILEFSATDGHLQRRVINDWTGIRGMVSIRGSDELAFFDSNKVEVYKRRRGGKETRLDEEISPMM